MARRGEKLILELLNEISVLPYLIEQGVVAAGEKVIIETLTGGVSNTVLAVTTDDRKELTSYLIHHMHLVYHQAKQQLQ